MENTLLKIQAAFWLSLASFNTHAAATELANVRVSPDITVTLASQQVADEGVAKENLQGSVTLELLGVLPTNADITAYHLLPNGNSLFSLDTAVTLAGGVAIGPDDVVRFNGSAFSLEFVGSAVGVPAGARVDALSVHGSGDLLLSFDTSVTLGDISVGDEDLVRFNNPGFSLFFDGSAAGIATGLDLDAAHYLPSNGKLLLSFDSNGGVGGVNFSDEDLLEYDLGAATWAMAYDGSSKHLAWNAADLDAAFVTAADEFTEPIFINGFE